uniref:Uncharacterized protein n=1 Tax=Cacopsylla melanoneura TaxID=428564 RepID=A0A8D8U2J8_9HEMI
MFLVGNTVLDYQLFMCDEGNDGKNYFRKMVGGFLQLNTITIKTVKRKIGTFTTLFSRKTEYLTLKTIGKLDSGYKRYWSHEKLEKMEMVVRQRNSRVEH